MVDGFQIKRVVQHKDGTLDEAPVKPAHADRNLNYSSRDLRPSHDGEGELDGRNLESTARHYDPNPELGTAYF